MDLKLTTWERLTVKGLIGRLQGDALLIHRCLRIFDIIELNETEKEEINFHKINTRFEWDDPLRRWDIHFDDLELVELIKMTIQNNNSWIAKDAREIAALHNVFGLPWPAPVSD